MVEGGSADELEMFKFIPLRSVFVLILRKRFIDMVAFGRDKPFNMLYGKRYAYRCRTFV